MTLSFTEFMGEEESPEKEETPKTKERPRRRLNRTAVAQEVDAVVTGLNKMVNLFWPKYALTDFERQKAVEAIVSECELNPYLYRFFTQVGKALPHWKFVEALMIIIPPRLLMYWQEREKKQKQKPKTEKTSETLPPVSVETGGAPSPRRPDRDRKNNVSRRLASLETLLDLSPKQAGPDVPPGADSPNIGFAVHP